MDVLCRIDHIMCSISVYVFVQVSKRHFIRFQEDRGKECKKKDAEKGRRRKMKTGKTEGNLNKLFI